MALEHEYALLDGVNRSQVGRWIAIVAASVSALLVFVALHLLDIAEVFGLNVNVPPTALSLLGAGTVYTAIYWLLDRHLWRNSRVGKLLKIPNLAGDWSVEGIGLDKGVPAPWRGKIVIVQSWDKIRVHLITSTSSSDSIAAALQYDAAVGYRLLYHYRNQPSTAHNDMAPHHGFAELLFSKDEQAASGDYFNGRGRNTFGTMSIRREHA